jgi:hypothetical protein
MLIRIYKIVGLTLALSSFVLPGIMDVIAHAGNTRAPETTDMIDIQTTEARLRDHLKALTVDIGERSVLVPGNLKKTAGYIRDFYKGIGIEARLEPYGYHGFEVANVVAEIAFGRNPAKRILIGAHYDSIAGTVGADDNASAVAVQLETARQVMALKASKDLDLSVVFVSFALEEPPAYGTRFMGSRVYAEQARSRGERIDGMLCLEMVGYTCSEPGCQSYPFPLMFFGYPKKGNFIGIVGNFDSLGLTRRIHDSFQKNPDVPAIKLTVPFNGWIMPAVRLSDHASFWDEGFKAVMITDSAFYRNPHYHQVTDTMDMLDYRFMAELVESLVTFFSPTSRIPKRLSSKVVRRSSATFADSFLKSSLLNRSCSG